MTPVKLSNGGHVHSPEKDRPHNEVVVERGAKREMAQATSNSKAGGKLNQLLHSGDYSG
jgi:hypothetical protein